MGGGPGALAPIYHTLGTVLAVSYISIH